MVEIEISKADNYSIRHVNAATPPFYSLKAIF